MAKSVVEYLGVALAVIVIVLTVLAFPLRQHGYQLPFGWNEQKLSGSTLDVMGACAPLANPTPGFPFTEQRPTRSCIDGHNNTAFMLNNGIYIAGWLSIATLGVGSAVFLGRRVHAKGSQDV
jgi:hypothetical protein